MGDTPDVPDNPAPPKLTDPAVEEARIRERELQRRRKGRQSMIYTGGQGVAVAPVTEKSNLFGGGTQ